MTDKWTDFCKTFIPKIKSRHVQMLGCNCDLEHPKKFTDKLEWLKIYDSTFLKTYCADKIIAREYVKNKLGIDISIPLIGVYDKFDDIDFSKLPKDYVIKTNHGSHTNIIVRNGNLNKNQARQKFNEWLSKDWSWYGYELHYIPIQRKILIEKFMSSEQKTLLDYKFFCFNGIPKVMYIGDDGNYQNPTCDFFDMNFNHLDITMHDPNAPICPTKPKNFEQMKEYANKLCKDFKFVRVDFYEIDGKVYFGELTFIPSAAYINYRKKEDDYIFGDMLKL